MVTQVAEKSTPWGAYQPVDVILGEEWNMDVSANRRNVVDIVNSIKPDLVVITPPCGPWCAWQRLCQDYEALDKLRKGHLPYWKMTREIWDSQTREGRLALTEQPEGSEALDTNYMTGRDPLYRVVVDQCVFGLKDPVSHKFYRKSTALDVNDKDFAEALAKVQRCPHSPDEHEQIRGSVKVNGVWKRRSELASAWTAGLANHVLKAAEAAIFKEETDDEDVLVSIPVESDGEVEVSPELRELLDFEGDTDPTMQWTLPVEVEGGVLTPEEVLKRQLRQFGAEGDEYDYITFEGQAKLLVRRVRRVLAHLHVALGHISNDRLHRMLSLAGASGDLLSGARRLRCQVCCMVRPPASRPQVSYLKPTNFNQRVSGDVFFVWDVKGIKYAAVHFLDELTDYHIGALAFDPTSEWAADVLCRNWYDVFGPPDVLITDGGTEFQGAVNRLNDLFGVQHDLIPDQAKWRLGHAERHGAILKIMMMKVIVELQVDCLRDMQTALTSCLAAKNRLINGAGVAPIQAVTGRNSPLPGSLMAQITSGKVRFKTNEEITKDEALRRGERIRSAAIEAYHWLDAHEGLRKALAARSRPPALELLREGTTVYVYDPPANRRGLARRIQDNVSWSGPAVM
eukprot:s849_g6.t1